MQYSKRFRIRAICIAAAVLSIMFTGSHAMAADDPEYTSYGGVSLDYNQDGVSEFIFDSEDLYNNDTTYTDSAGEYVKKAADFEKKAREAVE